MAAISRGIRFGLIALIISVTSVAFAVVPLNVAPWPQIEDCALQLKTKLEVALYNQDTFFTDNGGYTYDPKALASLPGTLAWSYLEIATASGFEDQYSEDFKAIVLKSLGLCAPTTFVNVALAARRFFSVNIDAYSNVKAVQIDDFKRISCDVKTLNKGMNIVMHVGQLSQAFAAAGIGDLMETKAYDWSPHYQPLLTDNFAKERNSIFIVGVRSQRNEDAPGHALVILNLDFKRGMALVSDPNMPNAVSEVPFTRDRNNQGLVFPRGIPNRSMGPCYVFQLLEIMAKRPPTPTSF